MRSKSFQPSKTVNFQYLVSPGEIKPQNIAYLSANAYLKSQYNFNRLGLSYINKNNENRITTKELRKWDSSIAVEDVFEVGAGNGVLVNGLKLEGVGRAQLDQEGGAVRLRVDTSCQVDLGKGLKANHRNMDTGDWEAIRGVRLGLEGIEAEGGRVGRLREGEEIAFFMADSHFSQNDYFSLVVVFGAFSRIEEVSSRFCDSETKSRANRGKK